MAASVENWDDDVDFQGDFFPSNLSTTQTAFSSRRSAHSESNIAEEDWQLLIKPNDEPSRSSAISSAKLAGVPIPSNVPASALIGGSIKRLGKKKSRPKVVADDDWGDDLELPAPGSGGLKLRTAQLPTTPSFDDESEDWGEGSLGIRFAGTRRDGRGRGSSVSAMSPSMNSCITLESEDDDLNGLVLPTGAIDFKARLSIMKDSDKKASPNVSPLPPHAKLLHREPTLRPMPEPVQESRIRHIPPPSKPVATLQSSRAEFTKPNVETKPTLAEDANFFADLDIASVDLTSSKKLNINRNVKIQSAPTKQQPALRTVTSLTFTDKASASKIPRPQLSTKPSRLDPVYEGGNSLQPLRNSRAVPTTTNTQLLRAKRSAPVLRNNYNQPTATIAPKSSATFRPSVMTSRENQGPTTRSSQNHLRRDSDPSRAKSPVERSFSRLSSQQHLNQAYSQPRTTPDTPSRVAGRRDFAPAALAREAAAKRTFTKPAKRRNYGDGSELEVFDDLPTSTAKENKFVKVPIGRGAPKGLRSQTSMSRFPLPDRMATPMPLTPSTVQSIQSEATTPRFARDTAASRIAREQRLNARSRAEGQIMPVQRDWKAHVAARSPQNSPTTLRPRRGSGQRPMLIKPLSTPMVKNEKGMIYNPILHRWEGNKGALAPFHHQNHSATNLTTTTAAPSFAPTSFASRMNHHQHSHSQPLVTPNLRQPAPTQGPSSPTRPALISNISTARGVLVERGMVFDPRRMCWLKLDPTSRSGTDPISPLADDEDDPFAGLEDLKDETHKITVGAGAASVYSNNSDTFSQGGSPGNLDATFVGEEFDLGPGFIRRQREEEANWRRRVEGWVGSDRDAAGEGWKWAVRELAAVASEGLRR